MKTAALLLLFCLPAPAQTGCVIVKRHDSHLGENMTRWHPHRPFDYVEGAYPSGYKWRGELGDGEVRDIQKQGGKVVIMKADYQTVDLEGARKQCQSTEASFTPR